MIITLFVLMGIETAMANTYEISKNGMHATIKVEENSATIRLSAPAKGWFLIGFHPGETLQNARLFFVSHQSGITRVEEHRTDFSYPPPYHKIVENNRTSIKVISGKETKERKTATFTIPLAGHFPGQIDLSESADIFVTLAYSTSNDFNHHSTMRTSLSLTLKSNRRIK